MADLTDDIESLATNPQSVTVDGVSMTEFSLESLIAADRYLKATAGAAKAHRGLRFTKLQLPPHVGNTDDS